MGDIVERLDTFLRTNGLFAGRADESWMRKGLSDAKAEILSIRQQVGKLEAALQVLSTLEPQAAFHDGWGVAHEANRIARAALEAD